MSTTTMTIHEEKLLQFQNLVKAHNLRFVGNPFIASGRAHVCVDSDHLPPGGCNQFWSDWQRLNTPIREVHSPKWKQILRRLGFKL